MNRPPASRASAAAVSVARQLTSEKSVAAMMCRPGRPKDFTISEDDWTDPGWKALSAYIVSKTRAEQAVWEWAEKNAWKARVAVVNPAFVLGPMLDEGTCTSIDVLTLMLTGAYPAMPKVAFPIVDVRDIASLHVAAT